MCEARRQTSPNLVGTPYIVAGELEADVVGVNPMSDIPFRAADESGHDELSGGERPPKPCPIVLDLLAKSSRLL